MSEYKRFFYDLHIHSCLSPCGDNDMTPYNLVNMAKLNELDVIALTDHNSCKNCPAAAQAAKQADINFICGMELCTSEEIHIVCLFPTLQKAMEFDEYIETLVPDIPNKPEIFGDQLIMDSRDNVVEKNEKLLVTAANIGIENVPKTVAKYDGICYPAHIDRSSYSVLSALGAIPEECGFTAAEITSRGDVAALKAEHDLLCHVPLILSSDAHYLEDIHPRRAWLELERPDARSVIEALSGNCHGFGRG